MKSTYYKLFNVMIEIVLSCGGDGSGLIVVNESRFDDIKFMFIEWFNEGLLKGWTLNDSNILSIIIYNNQESLTLSCDKELLDNPFYEYKVNIL